MVSPIVRNPNQDPEEEVKRAAEQKRKAPPTKDFSEALEQVDQRRQQQSQDEGKELKGTKKTPAGAFVKKKESPASSSLMSPFDLAKGVKNQGEDLEDDSDVLASLQDVADASLLKTAKDRKSLLDNQGSPAIKKTLSAFEAVEQHDIDTINPQGYVETRVAPAPITTSIQPVDNKAPVPLPRPIHEIMNEIVKQIEKITLEGKTETTIDLKGKFEGSRLIITQFDSDKNAMNITIDNLTSPNQQLVDAHKNTLIKNLDDINIHVHIFTASSTIELNPLQVAKSDTGQSDHKERNPRDGRKQNREQAES